MKPRAYWSRYGYWYYDGFWLRLSQADRYILSGFIVELNRLNRPPHDPRTAPR